MVMLEKRENEYSFTLKLIKTGGYLVLIGVFIGVTLEVYALLNPPLFSIFNNISQYETASFFLSVYLPSFITVVAIGYVFATIPNLEKFNLWRTATLCLLALLCLALSALSIVNIFAFLGGIIALAAIIFAHTKPTFKVLWKREASFFLETGTILIASSSMLFLLMLLISGLLQTYSAGVYEVSYSYPYLLFLMIILSSLTFLVTPYLCLYGTNVGLCGIIGLTVGILSFMAIIRNQYVYFSQSVWQGIFLWGVGTILMFVGALVDLRLVFSEIASPTLEPSFVYDGRFCAYCGERWLDANKVVCPKCGRNLFWKLEKSFCPYCGRLVVRDVNNCLHCGEYVASLPVYISPKEIDQEKLLSEIREPGKLQKSLDFLLERINKILAWTELSFKEFLYMGILTFLFAFLLFFAYVKIEFTPLGVNGHMVFHYGFPLEWLEVVAFFPAKTTVRIVLPAIILNLILCVLLAFVIVYGSKKAYERVVSLR
jgi:hypothetical protein